MPKTPESFRRYVLRGVVIALALLVLLFVLLMLFVLSLPEGWNTLGATSATPQRSSDRLGTSRGPAFGNVP